ncbi:unnamed protein product [Prorocentrum cordatum]|uniref:Uncharacterized protein n=1 Tax=Prorocentrum cordatum TaxID=2364126 RepID=A0ABN9XW82_9DINO|nr:unnamed protein product [Polarella glacialis]
MRALTQQAAGLAKKASAPCTGAAAPEPNGGPKGGPGGDQASLHQRTALQEKGRRTKPLQSDHSGLQEQLASVAEKIQEKQEAIAASGAEVEVSMLEADMLERALLEARGERPTAKAKLASVAAEEIVEFDFDDEPFQVPGAKEALAAFKASPHFGQIKEALYKFVALIKGDVEQLWKQLHKGGQQPSPWTKEQLEEAVTSAQSTKHRKTAEIPELLEMTRTFEPFSANKGKKTLQRRPRRSTAVVILAQEIGHAIGDCESLNSRFAAHGWQC